MPDLLRKYYQAEVLVLHLIMIPNKRSKPIPITTLQLPKPELTLPQLSSPAIPLDLAPPSPVAEQEVKECLTVIPTISTPSKDIALEEIPCCATDEKTASPLGPKKTEESIPLDYIGLPRASSNLEWRSSPSWPRECEKIPATCGRKAKHPSAPSYLLCLSIKEESLPCP